MVTSPAAPGSEAMAEVVSGCRIGSWMVMSRYDRAAGARPARPGAFACCGYLWSMPRPAFAEPGGDCGQFVLFHGAWPFAAAAQVDIRCGHQVVDNFGSEMKIGQ